MALSIRLKLPSGFTPEFTWYTGQANPVNYHDVQYVTEIQADGHELEHIIFTMFRGHNPLPIPRGNVVRFFGDDTKTIVGNLTNG